MDYLTGTELGKAFRALGSEVIVPLSFTVLLVKGHVQGALDRTKVRFSQMVQWENNAIS